MKNIRVGKNWLYIPLVAMAIFYLLPMYVMLATGFKAGNIDIDSFIDVQTVRVDSEFKGRKVYSPDIIGKNDSDCFYISTVQRWDSWDEIRRLFAERGKTEGSDYIIM